MQGLIPDFVIRKVHSSDYQGGTDAVVLFADLQGFTGLTESWLAQGKTGAEKLSRLLDRVFGTAATEIHSRGGFIPHFAGDAFSGIFPGRHALPALEAAVAIQSFMEGSGLPIPLRIGIGNGSVHWQITREIPHRWYIRGDGMDSAVQAQQDAGPGEIRLATTFRPDEWAGYTFTSGDHSFLLSGSPPSSSTPHWPISGFDPSAFFPSGLLARLQGAAFRMVTGMFVSVTDSSRDLTAGDWLSASCCLIERKGGYVKEIDFTDKGGLMVAFFGAPVTEGHSRERAVQAAADLLQLCRQTGPPIRVGLATGPAFCGLAGNAHRRQYIVAGRSVNLAARLALQAREGEARSDTDTLKGLSLTAQSLGPVVAKGFSAPVDVWSFCQGPITSARDKTNFHDPELIQRLSDRLRHHETPVVELTGDPGSGKSFVARAVVRSLETDFTWLSVEGRVTPTDALAALTQAWLQLGGSGAIHLQNRMNALPDDLPAKERYLQREEILRQSLTSPASDRPLAVWVEHWADLDPPSRDLLLEAAHHHTIRLLLTSRTPLLSRAHISGYVHQEIDGLDERGLARLVLQRTGAAPSVSLLNLLLKTTRGNPFFAEQFLRYLQEHALVWTDTDGQMQVSESKIRLGGSLRDILLARFDQLGPEIGRALQWASVIGKKFTVEELRDAMGRLEEPVRHLEEYLLEAAEAGILDPEGNGTFVFRHSLMREAIYDLPMNTWLQKAHEAVGLCLEIRAASDSAVDLPALARHFRKGGQSAKAGTWFRQAIANALITYQNIEAIALYEEAVAEALPPESEAAIRLDVLPAFLSLNRWQESASLLEDNVWKEAPDNLKTWRLARKGQVNMLRGDYPGAERDLKGALQGFESARDQGGQAFCARELSILFFRKGDYAKAEAYIRQTFLLPGQGQDNPLLINLALIRMNQGRYVEAEHILYDDLMLRFQTGEKEPLPALLTNLGVVQNEMGRLDKALEHLDKGLTLAREAGSRLWMSIALGTRGMVHEQNGDWQKALDDYQADLKLALEMGDRQGTAIAGELLGSLHLRLGRQESGEPLLLEALKGSRDLGYLKGEVKCLISLGRHAAWTGRQEQAGEWLEHARQTALSIGNQRLLINARLALAERFVLLQQPQAARPLLEEVESAVVEGEIPSLLQDWMVLRLQTIEGEDKDALIRWALDHPVPALVRAEALAQSAFQPEGRKFRRAAIDAYRLLYQHTPYLNLKLRREWLEIQWKNG